MKKSAIVMLSVVMCLAAMAMLTGCGGGNNQALEERIAAVEQENQRLKQELDAIKGGGSETVLKIYKVGETATVYESGMPMFTLKYDSKTTTANFTIKNIGLIYQYRLDQIIEAMVIDQSFDRLGSRTIPSSYLKKDAEVQFAFELSSSSNGKYFSFLSLSSHMVLVFFEI